MYEFANFKRFLVIRITDGTKFCSICPSELSRFLASRPKVSLFTDGSFLAEVMTTENGAKMKDPSGLFTT